MADKTVAIVQSNYIPWKGYFDLIGRVDEFVLFDDVQYTRRDWRNRNLIKTPQGLHWLSIPVDTKGKYTQLICETKVIDGSWAAAHWRTIQQFYRAAPFFDECSGVIAQWYDAAGKCSRLSDVNFLFISEVCQFLGIGSRLSWSTDYPGEGEKSKRLLSVCQQTGATTYLSGPAAKSYLQEDLFATKGVRVEWMDYAGYPEYPQLYGDFEHGVTVLDLLLNVGPEARRFVTNAAS